MSRKKKKKYTFGKGFKVTLKIAVIFLLVVGAVCVGLLSGVTVGCVITTKALTTEELYGTDYVTKIYDSKGNVIGQLRGADQKNSEWAEIGEIPKDLQHAFVAIEDERFYTHSGVDVKRTVSAVLGFLVPGLDGHGGSTITQQVVKNITGDDARSVPRKIREQWRALQLEKDLEKDDILELYLNIINFANAYGVKVAARTYFNKELSELNLAECAFLAGIPNSPRKYNPATTTGRKNAYSRQITILDAMMDQGYISKEEYIEAIQTELNFQIDAQKADTGSTVYSYFMDSVIRDVRNDLMAKGYTKAQANQLIYNSGIEIYSTQDSDIQAIVDSVYCNPNYFPANGDRDPEDCTQSAITIIDQRNGYIVAMYGGYGEKTQSLSYNRATDIKRQPGSAIKPVLVYGPLIDAGIITAGSALDEMPAHLDTQNPSRIWPSNWDNFVHGLLNARYALDMSYNVPAATWFSNNISLCLGYMKKAGIDRTGEPYISTALGGFQNGISPTELAAAYVPIANGGVYYKPVTYSKVYDRSGKLLLDNTASAGTVIYEHPETSTIVTSMLQSVMDDPRSTGRYAQMYKTDGTKIPAGGKTGTTNDIKDYWFSGFTDYYTAAVWYGYDNGTPINEKLESGSAMIIWKAIMSRIHEDLLTREFVKTGDLVTVEICTSSGKRATEACKADPRAEHWVYEEIYRKGTEPAANDFCDLHVSMQVCRKSVDAYGKFCLATPYCKDTATVTGLFRQELPEDLADFTPEMFPTDWQYEISHEYCAVCGGGIYDPENPENPENPEDPADPENPGGSGTGDPADPENPGGSGTGDPADPENPGGSENENPANPENPGSGGTEDPADPENPGEGETEPPEDPENPGGGESGDSGEDTGEEGDSA